MMLGLLTAWAIQPLMQLLDALQSLRSPWMLEIGMVGFGGVLGFLLAAMLFCALSDTTRTAAE